VAHTGKLARAIPLDLALLDVTGDEGFWRRAVERAGYVISRLAPDPEHGALIYLPGRLDPRNCSSSAIDSGECTDALGRLLLHARAATLPPDERARIWHAVERNAETYLRAAVVEKGITNQRLWGAMGLAMAYACERRPAWLDTLRESLARACGEQRADGSWGYQPEAEREGAHRGAADLTVYYHSRCLAFIGHVLDHAPAADPAGAALDAIERGLRFLAAVILPGGLKPLALEGKRWFWDGSYEAGSNAYDVDALLWGSRRFGRAEWRDLALRCWRTLAAHQRRDGALVACLDPGNADFVCPDFHTADLAWPAQRMAALPLGETSPPAPSLPGGQGDLVGMERGGQEAKERRQRGTWTATSGFAVQSPVGGAPAAARVLTFADAGVIRLETARRVALVRTRKEPANTQFGGAVGGGSAAAITATDGRPLLVVRREHGVTEAAFGLRPRSRPGWRDSLGRFLRANPPEREGRQWLFVARLLLRQGRAAAAVRRLWLGYFGPLWRSLADEAGSQWATGAHVGAGRALVATSRPARPDGSVPEWADGVQIRRSYTPAGHALEIAELLTGEAGAGERVGRIDYLVPRAAAALAVAGEGLRVERQRSGRLVVATPVSSAFRLSIAFRL
jgi:hypothetical protein